jgi:hypothetical protein
MVSKDKCTVACSVVYVYAFINPVQDLDPDQYPDPRFFSCKWKILLLKKLDLILKHGNS